MIGLKRHTVRVVEHQAQWAELYHHELQVLQNSIGALVIDIQHIGSTSVPNLYAKPIMDIGVAVRSKDDIAAVVKNLSMVGYLDRGDAGSDGGYLLIKESQPDIRIVHMHIVEIDDVQWENYLKFRDTLRADSELRERYGALKRHLAEKYPDDRKCYTSGKHEFVQNVIRT